MDRERSRWREDGAETVREKSKGWGMEVERRK